MACNIFVDVVRLALTFISSIAMAEFATIKDIKIRVDTINFFIITPPFIGL